MIDGSDRAEPLVALLVDPERGRSPLGHAVRGAGHRLITAAGAADAVAVLAGLCPDLVLLRATAPGVDRVVLARLRDAAPGLSLRVVATPLDVAAALAGAAAPAPLFHGNGIGFLS